MPLNNLKVRSAKPCAKAYKLSDEKSLFLLVKPNGSKYWRFKYRFGGKEKQLSLGVFPDVTLASARSKRDELRQILADGKDPSAARKAKKHEAHIAHTNNFKAVTKEWLIKRGKKSESGDSRLKRMIERDLYPDLASKPLSEITPPVLLGVIRKIEARGAVETAHRAKQYVGQIFRYAIATGRAERDPSADLKGALASPVKTHFAAITEPKAVGKLMRGIAAYEGSQVVKSALQLSALVFCRPGELRHLEWEDVNWEKKRIEIPGERMKIGQPHIIPLSTQAEKLLRDLQHRTGDSKFIFPSARGKTRPLSENGVRVALRSMGYSNDQMTAHGFRATARTLLDEELGFRIEWIEQQLGHAVKDHNGRAYNRTKHLKQRGEMMQSWANYLESLRDD